MQLVITTAVVHSELQGVVCVTLYEFNIIFPLDLPLPPCVFGLTVEDFIYSFHHLFIKKEKKEEEEAFSSWAEILLNLTRWHNVKGCEGDTFYQAAFPTGWQLNLEDCVFVCVITTSGLWCAKSRTFSKFNSDQRECCVVCISTTLLQTEISQQVDDGLPWNFPETFVVPRGRSFNDFGDHLTFPVVKPRGWHLWLRVTTIIGWIAVKVLTLMFPSGSIMMNLVILWLHICCHHQVKNSICPIQTLRCV